MAEEQRKWWEDLPPSPQKLKDGDREKNAVREPTLGQASMPRWQWQQRLAAALKIADSIDEGTETRAQLRYLAMFVRELSKMTR